MRIYTIHRPRRPWPSGVVSAAPETALAAARAVKEGFSWPAFFFSVLWALWHRLWLVALVLVLIEIAFGLAAEAFAVDPIVQLAVSLGLALIVGWIGNDLIRARCERKGLAFAGVAMAETNDDALRRFFVESAPGGAPVS